MTTLLLPFIEATATLTPGAVIGTVVALLYLRWRWRG
jgi:hypothetical protein